MSPTNRRALTGTTLVVLAVLFLAVVLLSSVLLRGARLDLTRNGLYTLSSGTEAILGKLEEPVKLTFYYSDQAARDIPQLRTYATRVRELLEEIAAKSGGKVRLDVIDPLPFSEEEDRATAAGLQAVPIGNGGDNLFFGLVGANSTDGEAVIPFFQPDKEAFLEYDVAKLISGLATDELPIVGLISGLNMSPGFDQQTGTASQGWMIDAELRKLFEVQAIEPNASAIPDTIQTLMLVHPKNLSDELLYAIDQFVLRGGHLLVFVDPNAEAEQAGQGMDPAMAMFAEKSSDLPKLFAAWGVSYDPKRVVLDGRYALEIQPSPDQAPVRHLALLGLRGSESGETALNADDVVSAQLDQINFQSAGWFDLVEGASAKLEPLAQSSDGAMPIGTERVRSLPDPESLFADFTPTGQRYALAARLTGTLKTAFPERKDEKHLAESKQPANVVLVADTDLLTDRLWVRVQQFFGQRIADAFADNGNFAINAVDNLVGSGDLISVRTRPGSSLPFDTVDDLKRSADERFRAKEEELQSQLAETERKLTELQSAKGDKANAMLLSPEQQDALLRFQEEKLRIRKELRGVRAQLNADIESLGSKLKFINIAWVPLLLTFGALIWIFLRSRARRQEALQ